MADDKWEALKEAFGDWAIKAGQELDPVWGAAIARMTVKEIIALDAFINAKKVAEAAALVREKMTAPELAAEKEVLAGWLQTAAADQYKIINLGKELLLAGAKALITATVGMAFL